MGEGDRIARRASTRTRRCLLAQFTALCFAIFMAMGGTEANAGGPCVECSGNYSGTWTATVNSPNNPPYTTQYTEKLTLNWAASLVWNSAHESEWTLTTASGIFTLSGRPQASENCTVNLGPGPGSVVKGDVFWVATAAGKGLNGAEEGKYETLIAGPPVGWGEIATPRNPLQVTGGSGSECAHGALGLEGPWAQELSGGNCHYDPASGHDWVAFPVGSSFTVPDECSASGSKKSGERETSWTAKLQDSFSLNVPGSGGSGGPVGSGNGPVFGPWLDKAKRDAYNDLKKTAIPNAAHYCLPYVGNLALATAGVLTLALGPGPGMIAATGSLTAATLAPFCTATLTRVRDDIRTYKDPPLASIHVLATPVASVASRLPSCRGYTGRAARTCASLRATGDKLDEAASRTTSLAKAIEETVSREHAAYLAHNQGAINSQDAHLRSLLRSIAGARSAEAQAGRSFARVLSSVGARFKLNRSQSAETIALAERELTKRGVGTAELTPIAPTALTAAAVNLLADLARI